MEDDIFTGVCLQLSQELVLCVQFQHIFSDISVNQGHAVHEEVRSLSFPGDGCSFLQEQVAVLLGWCDLFIQDVLFQQQAVIVHIQVDYEQLWCNFVVCSQQFTQDD